MKHRGHGRDGGQAANQRMGQRQPAAFKTHATEQHSALDDPLNIVIDLVTAHCLVSRYAVLHERVEHQVCQHQRGMQRRCSERVVAPREMALVGFEFLADGVTNTGGKKTRRRLGDDMGIDDDRRGVHLQVLHPHHLVVFIVEHDQPTGGRVTRRNGRANNNRHVQIDRQSLDRINRLPPTQRNDGVRRMDRGLPGQLGNGCVCTFARKLDVQRFEAMPVQGIAHLRP
ncbi:hypothetical protein D3C72_1555810 [compost metagenome]